MSSGVRPPSTVRPGDRECDMAKGNALNVLGGKCGRVVVDPLDTDDEVILEGPGGADDEGEGENEEDESGHMGSGCPAASTRSSKESKTFCSQRQKARVAATQGTHTRRGARALHQPHSSGRLVPMLCTGEVVGSSAQAY